MQVFVQSPSVALAPGVPGATDLQVIVERSQRCGQEPAGGGLLVAQPAMEETVSLYWHFSGSSTLVMLCRLHGSHSTTIVVERLCGAQPSRIEPPSIR